MLIDTILNEGKSEPDIYDPAPMLDRLKTAHKFVLAKDFAQVADELATKPNEIIRMLPFVKLPFNNIWIEVVHSDREWFERGTPVAYYESKPTRVGYLLTSTGPLSSFKAQLFWNFANERGAHTTLLAMHYDCINGFPYRKGLYYPAHGDSETNKLITARWDALSEDDRAKLSCLLSPIAADIIDFQASQSIHDKLLEISIKDWGGECIFIIAVLGLLNTRNVWEREEINMTHYNTKRRAKGQKPLSSHQVISISRRLKIRPAAASTGRYGDLRAHFVRGHWKVRSTGIFFWKPFVRGQGTNPTLKPYKLSSKE